ncbi:MAG TPA: hypothetical protein VGX96_05995 [Candidatus Elarobacter sp.]|jgi:hypothetical protein|nr:hypothetical protein [Candidatus Elarobacter sp.]
MNAPTDDELAAIAAAYVIVTRAPRTPMQPEPSRWRLAARLSLTDPDVVRPAARNRARWRTAAS